MNFYEYFYLKNQMNFYQYFREKLMKLPFIRARKLVEDLIEVFI